MKLAHHYSGNLSLAVVLSALAMTLDAYAADKLDRTVLPIAEPQRLPIITLDARNVKAPPRFEVKAPADAPNVLIVLLDDFGFGHVQRIRRTDPHADRRTTGQ